MTYLETKKAAPAIPDPPPPALVRFMMEGWAPPPATLPPLRADAAAFATRRRTLSARFPDETLVIPTGHEKVRANDTSFPFRPGSDFVWLTGHLEPDAVLVLAPGAAGRHEAHLFLEPHQGKRSESFFVDRRRGELWVGRRHGVDEARAESGVDAAHPLSELKTFLDLRPGARVLRGLSPPTDALVPPRSGAADQELAAALSELRMIKDELEIAELRRAIASTKRGFEDVIRGLASARSEREVEALFAARARAEGNGVGYGTVAASGPHACILHWTRNDGPLKAGDLLLLDAGVERRSLYTADITRTLPVSGRFSAAQRELYELVHRAQRAALAQVKPGADFMAPNRHAMQVLARGLETLGILRTSAEEALREEHQFHKRYALHTVSHMLGLDVHDCASARPQTYRQGTLQPGMVLTIEPGLYFQPDDLTVPARYRGIGVRIEDDVLVTTEGAENLSRAIPRSAPAIERWMAAVRQSGERRRASASSAARRTLPRRRASR